MNVKVLVVEDDRDYRLIIEEYLKPAGMEVRAAKNGEEALEILKTYSPDIALVDWMMPRLDGEAFCRALRADPRHARLPILMVTVKKEAEEQAEALHFGADGFINKPFKPEELRSRIQALLRIRAAS
jgi:DNA-binding response OmpR family regulator